MVSRRKLLAFVGGAATIAAIPPVAHFFGKAARERGLCLAGREVEANEDLALIPRLGFGAEMQDFIAFCKGRYDTLCFLDTSHSRGLTRLSLLARPSMRSLIQNGYESLHTEDDYEGTLQSDLRDGKINRATFLKQFKSGEWLDVRLAYAEAHAQADILEDKTLPLIVPVDARHSVAAPTRDYSAVPPALVAKLDAALEGFLHDLTREGFIKNMNFSCQGNWHQFGALAERAVNAFLQATQDEPAENIAALYGTFKLKIFDTIYGNDEATAKVIVENSPPALKTDADSGKGIAVFFGAGHLGEHSRLIADEPSLLEHLEEMERTPILIALLATGQERDEDYKGKAFIEAILREETITPAKLLELSRQSEAGELETTLYSVEFILHPDKQEVRINDGRIRRAFDAWLSQNGRLPRAPSGSETAPRGQDTAPR